MPRKGSTPISEKLIGEWDYDLNTITPSDVSAGSKKKVWWICQSSTQHKHSYECSPVDRKRGRQCPYCSGRKVLSGFNDLATINPHIASEWDYEKNDDTPSDITSSCSQRRWFKCPQGHIYETIINSRSSMGSGCPYCSGNKVSECNSFYSTHKHLIEMWDKEKNDQENISFHSNSAGSNVKAWWTCGQGHSWSASFKKIAQGRRCPYCSGNKVLLGFNDLLTQHPEIADEWDFDKNTISPHEVTRGSHKKVWWKCENGHSWKSRIYSRVGFGTGCPSCSRSVSRSEFEIADFIDSITPENTVILRNDRTVIAPYELDIYLPDKNIAVEFNGVYWHSEACGKDKNYHYNKWKMCHDQDVQLITIWEDDWRDRKDIVTSMLRHKLGVSNTRRVFARSTTIRPIDYHTSSAFLDKYHIQGHAPGSAYLGAFSDDEKLVAVSVWRKVSNELYLDRYATSCTVVGGMGKMLSAGQRCARDNNISTISTFSDHEVSDGSLYKHLGFTPVSDVRPDYSYVVNMTRRHKFNYRKKRFVSDESLLYDPVMTESQLAELNGFVKTWDCGKTKWSISV